MVMTRNCSLVLLVVCTMSLSVAKAQMASGKLGINAEKAQTGEISGEKIEFVFPDYVSIEDELDPSDVYNSHFLGDSVAMKWKALEDLYIERSDVTVGFGNTHVELKKPVIFNSLNKIEKHFKKEVKKDVLSVEVASCQFSRYLEYAYVIFYEDSEMFEQALAKSKSTEELIEIFNAIRLE